MPTIAYFLGIAIQMYYDDHPPPPIHVKYNEHQARFAIETGELISGSLPARAPPRPGMDRAPADGAGRQLAPYGERRTDGAHRGPRMTDVLVRKLHHLGGHRFAVEFTDGMAGVWDYSYVRRRTGPMAAPLHDEAYIARAFLEAGAPTWPNGWDVSPEALYETLSSTGALNRTAEAGSLP